MIARYDVVLNLALRDVEPDRLGAFVVDALRDVRHQWTSHIADQIEAQIRPPRPAEPQNVGAVVTARDGTRWTRVESATDTFSRNPWYPAAESDIQPAEWDEIDVVTVLSEGVQP